MNATPATRLACLLGAVLTPALVLAQAGGETPPDLVVPDVPDVVVPGFEGNLPGIDVLPLQGGGSATYVFYLPPADSSGVWERSVDFVTWTQVGEIVQTGSAFPVPAVQELMLEDDSMAFLRFRVLE